MSLRKQLLAVAAFLILLANGAEASKPCPRFEYALPDADVVVVGRILSWPIPGAVILEVDRYYRGTGPRILIAQPKAASSFYLWRTHFGPTPRNPVSPVVFAFHQGPGMQLYREGCDAWTHLEAEGITEALAKLAPGQAPGPGLGLHSHAVFTTPAWVLALAAGTFVWFRRRKRKSGRA